MQKHLGYFIDLLPKAGSANFTPSYSRINREIFLLETEIHFIISNKNSSKKEKKQSISSCIGLLSQFMDSLYEVGPAISNPETNKIQEVLLRLEKFIHGIELKAPNYFDYNLITPEFIAEQLKGILKKEHVTLKHKLQEFGMRDDLIEVTLEPFRKFLTKNKKVRFRRYFYLIRYQQWLQEFVHGTIHFGE